MSVQKRSFLVSTLLTPNKVRAEAGKDPGNGKEKHSGYRRPRLFSRWKTISFRFDSRGESTASITSRSEVEPLASNFCSCSPLNNLNLSQSSSTSPRTKMTSMCYRMEKNQYDEYGYLRFHTERLHEALEDANELGKPILCVDATLPGDVDCGREVFSHPLVVEAMESLFVLVRTDSSSWGRCCRTTLTILDSTGETVVASMNGTRASVIYGMIEALESLQLHVPKYLYVLREEEGSSSKRCCILGTSDAAIAEAELAGLDGVLSTRAGSIDRQSAVEIQYDSRRLSYGCLVRYALQRIFVNVIYFQSVDERVAARIETDRIHNYKTEHKALPSGTSVHPNYDPKRALRKTPLRFVPLTALQATRANRLVHIGRFDEAMHLLSPRQGLILRHAMRASGQAELHEVVDVPVVLAWTSLSQGQHPRTLMLQQEQYSRSSNSFNEE